MFLRKPVMRGARCRSTVPAVAQPGDRRAPACWFLRRGTLNSTAPLTASPPTNSLTPVYPGLTLSLAEEREQRRNEAFNLMLAEGSKAGAIATVAVTAFHYAANALWPAYRNFGSGTGSRSPKLFWLSSVVVAAFVVQAERSHLERMAQINDEDAKLQEAVDAANRASLVSKRLR